MPQPEPRPPLPTTMTEPQPEPETLLTHGAALSETSAAPAPGGTVSRYRPLRPLGRGGLGEVRVAHDEELHREVALKEVQPRHLGNPDSVARFLLEAEITGRLEHPGVVPVYGLGTHADGRPGWLHF